MRHWHKTYRTYSTQFENKGAALSGMVIIIYRILNARQLCIDFLKLNGIKLPYRILHLHAKKSLKVDGKGVGNNTVIQVLSGIVAIEGFLQFERAVSL